MILPLHPDAKPGVVPPLHLITSDQILEESEFLHQARAAIAAGGERIVVHLRARTIAARTLLALADELHVACSEAGARLCINDRLDLVLAVGNGWAHVGGASIPAEAARRVLGPDCLLGASIHGPDEVEGVQAHVDYVVAGTVFETPSHPDRPGRGPEFVQAVRAYSAVPVVAIGGVSVERVGTVVAAGADGIAVLSGVWKSGDPGGAVTRYLQALRDTLI